MNSVFVQHMLGGSCVPVTYVLGAYLFGVPLHALNTLVIMAGGSCSNVWYGAVPEK